MRAIIDTCVILDYLQGREPFFDDALNIAIASANREFEAYITASSLTDIHYIIHKSTHDNQKTRSILQRLTSVFGMVDTYAEDCINALHSDIVDYEDAVMTETAIRANIDWIVTRNIKDFNKSKVRAIAPADFLRNLK